MDTSGAARAVARVTAELTGAQAFADLAVVMIVGRDEVAGADRLVANAQGRS